MSSSFHCGYVALIGKPNTGKSTLMNALIGEKLSITAHRPQSTRHQILGIKTTSRYQCIFVDTPGIHQDQRKAINRYMNRAATSMLDDVDLICVLLEVRNINRDDEQILHMLEKYQHVLLVLNKIDQVKKPELLPLMQRLGKLMPKADIIPVSALKQDNLEQLMDQIQQYLQTAASYRGQGAWQQARLTEDLEAVADPDHRPANGHEALRKIGRRAYDAVVTDVVADVMAMKSARTMHVDRRIRAMSHPQTCKDRVPSRREQSTESREVTTRGGVTIVSRGRARPSVLVASPRPRRPADHRGSVRRRRCGPSAAASRR